MFLSLTMVLEEHKQTDNIVSSIPPCSSMSLKIHWSHVSQELCFCCSLRRWISVVGACGLLGVDIYIWSVCAYWFQNLCLLLLFDDLFGRKWVFFASLGRLQLFRIEVLNAINEVDLLFLLLDGYNTSE